MGKYVVTDLTEIDSLTVCVGVIDTGSGQCLRPIPMWSSDRVRKMNLHPGALLAGKLTLKPVQKAPHSEDATEIEELRYVRPASVDEFKEVLQRTLSVSVAHGFGYTFQKYQKYIPVGNVGKCSLITVRVNPSSLNVIYKEYEIEGKREIRKRVSVNDASGHFYWELPNKDRRYPNINEKHQIDGFNEALKQYISSHEEIFLRIGVGRRYCPRGTDKDGYWLQINGIYGYPEREFPL